MSAAAGIASGTRLARRSARGTAAPRLWMISRARPAWQRQYNKRTRERRTGSQLLMHSHVRVHSELVVRARASGVQQREVVLQWDISNLQVYEVEAVEFRVESPATKTKQFSVVM